MKQLYSYIIVLLFVLPFALQGQDFSHISKQAADDWQTIVIHGGLIRLGNDDEYFCRIDNGINSLMMMDFVNGYSVGPRTTFGKVLEDYSRIEIDENIRWACSRRTLMAKGAIRYVFAPQYISSFEVFGGHYTDDFDRNPVMGEIQRSFASGLFGWNHFKLYDQTIFGARLYAAISPEFQVIGLLAWEKREQVVNHRRNNIFGTKPKDNVPIVQGKAMESFGCDKILRIETQLDWMPGRKVVVIDDMNAIAHSDLPNFTLRATTGWSSGLRYLSLETSVIGAKKLLSANERLSYMASVGFFPIRKKVLLMDARHFDASEFAYQRGSSFTHFSLLDNYELSTSKSWAEAHGEWTDGQFYVQAHVATVPDNPIHSEAGIGYNLENIWRFGATIGFDNSKFDGVAFNICLNL